MKALSRYIKSLRATAKKGFTLIELAIVGLFLGLLAVFAISQFSGAATDNTRAVSLFEASTKISDNWSLLTQQCGASNDIAAAAFTGATGSAAQNLSMLLGNAQVKSDFEACYRTAGIRPLTGLAAGASGAEKVSGFPVSATTVDGAFLAVKYAEVPKSVFNAAAMKYANMTSASLNAANGPTSTYSATSTAAFQFTNNANGTSYDIYFVRPL